MYLYLIRHGESVYNAEGRIQGHADVALSALGRGQGEAVAERLAGYPIDALYASPLQRAYETAEIVHEKLGLPIQLDDRLKEVNVGIFQGEARSDLEWKYPEELARWKSEDLDYVLPQGESRRELIARGVEVLTEIASREEGHVAVASHGRILIMTIKAMLDLPHDEPPYSLQNGSLSILRYEAGSFELVALDETSHLEGVGLSGIGDL